MTESEKADFVLLLTDALAFYRRDVTPFVIGVWWQACQGVSLEQVRKAITAHAMDPEKGTFAPMPSDIVRQLQGTATDRSLLAWGKVFDAIGRVGAYRTVVFDDPAIHAVVEDLGGWAKVCRTETKELSYMQHRFCEAHRAYAGRDSFPYPCQLGGDGSHSSVWKAKGLAPPKPAVIGDVDTARRVYAGGSNSGKTPISLDSAVRLAIGHSQQGASA